MAHNNLSAINKRKFSIKHSLLISEKSEGWEKMVWFLNIPF